MTTHVDAMELVAYAQGRLKQRQARAVREHCLGCEDCGDQLAAVLLLREARPAAQRSEAWWPRIAAAMLVAAMALPLWWAVGGGEAPAPAPAPEREAAVTETAPLPVSLERAFGSLLWNLNRELPVVAPAGRSVADVDSVLRGAWQALDSGDADAALLRLAPLETADIRVDLLRGVAQLLTGDDANAEMSLMRAADAPIGPGDAQEQYRDAAMLFLSEAMVRSDDRQSAIRVLEQLVGPESAGRDNYADAAVARLQQLR